MKDVVQRSASARSFIAVNVVFSALVLLVWLFPSFWYRDQEPGRYGFWFSEQSHIPGWTFRTVPISESAEKILKADDIFNGEFSRDSGAIVRVYSAKRFKDAQDHIGLHMHPPDVCWTSVGWQIESTSPEVVGLDLHGVDLRLERRVFRTDTQRELVYFGGMVGGQPLPYRLDHFLASGKRRKEGPDGVGGLRESRLWQWLWHTFKGRRSLSGPQQFIRISTPVAAGKEAQADRLLAEFLPAWLQLSSYAKESIRP